MEPGDFICLLKITFPVRLCFKNVEIVNFPSLRHYKYVCVCMKFCIYSCTLMWGVQAKKPDIKIKCFKWSCVTYTYETS